MNGTEWIIEAHDCAVEALTDTRHLSSFFAALVEAMRLHTVGEALWHQFPDTAGVTGLLLLQESHLAIHTFPEYRSACLNVFCCRRRQPLDWHPFLQQWLGAGKLEIKELHRAYGKS